MKRTLKKIFNSKLKKITQFKNTHKGESCYLFGDGISLKYFNLCNFSDKIAIPCGFLPFHNDYDSLQVPYAMLIETYYFYPFIRFLEQENSHKKILLNSIQKEYRKQIKNRKETEFFLNISNYPVMYNDNITYLYKDIPDESLDKSYISNKFNCYIGSLRAQIMIAIYMGFDHVYLVGHDYTHSPAVSHHWYERGKGIVTPMPNFSKDFLEYAKKFINITTITAGSSSDNLDYVRYQDLFKTDLLYKENSEILKPNVMDILSTFPGYRIYQD